MKKTLIGIPRDSHILIVEDDVNRQRYFGRILKDCLHLYVFIDAPTCIKLLQEKDYWDIMFIDHDLGALANGCGRDVSKFLADNVVPITSIVIHSHNYVAAREMAADLHEYNVSVLPFGTFEIEVL